MYGQAIFTGFIAIWAALIQICLGFWGDELWVRTVTVTGPAYGALTKPNYQ